MVKPLTVSEFVESIRGLLRETISNVTIQGEVTDYVERSRDDLMFFSLKDSKSTLKCFCLKHELRGLQLENGLEVKATGSPSLFIKNAGFHLRVLDIQLVGAGALQKQFEMTKRRLEAEGLFRPERKRALPKFPNTIGLVTSPDAAAYTDVLRILKNRWPLVRVQLAAVAVQGPGAAGQIARALNQFSESRSADVIILTRGGGSLEDLQAFNDEGVARAIFRSAVPVVVGVGHERDETIADYVADERASTPSNAAERVVPSRAEVLQRLDTIRGQMSRRMASALELEQGNINGLAGRLGAALRVRLHRVDGLMQTFRGRFGAFGVRVRSATSSTGMMRKILDVRIEEYLKHRRHALGAIARTLHSLSPTAILQRGYSITRTADGRILRKRRDIRSGQSIRTTLSDGDLHSTVTHV